MVKVKFIGGPKHGELIDMPEPPLQITMALPNIQPLWSIHSDDPVDHKIVDMKKVVYTQRRFKGTERLFIFYAPVDWSDDDILEMFFT